jgi:Zn-dependent peptidase ImmA (M78 family)/transcriptional regulator with XRE-family HTH domain
MATRVEVAPGLLAWARERSTLPLDDLVRRFPQLPSWERGERAPTLKQLEAFAKATKTPVGFLLLPEPPEERAPIPDYRTFRDRSMHRPSPDLLETIYLCQQRQEWYRDFALSAEEGPLAFVGSRGLRSNPRTAAVTIAQHLGFTPEQRARFGNWSEALRGLSELAEAAGILVMVSGVVGNNTHRVLDPEEFRGFSLTDEYAPVIFVNGADTKAAQIFTVAHELGHLWLGLQGISNQSPLSEAPEGVERWCNDVAAEFLAPGDVVAAIFNRFGPLTEELDRLARFFKVSTLVILGRLRDLGLVPTESFRGAYAAELERILALREGPSGGDYYKTQPIRVSKRFARAVITSALEGRTLYRDAFQLLGLRRVETFRGLAQTLGVG